jgi:hypothetical protein
VSKLAVIQTSATILAFEAKGRLRQPRSSSYLRNADQHYTTFEATRKSIVVDIVYMVGDAIAERENRFLRRDEFGWAAL